MGELAPGLAQNLWVTAAALLACVLLLWLLSIRLRDISIIDIFYRGEQFDTDDPVRNTTGCTFTGIDF